MERESKSIRVDPVLWDAFKKATVNRNTTMSEVMEDAIREWMGMPPREDVPPHLRKVVDLLKERYETQAQVEDLIDLLENKIIIAGSNAR